MPKIPRVIATERPGALQLPRDVPFARAEDLGAGAFRELEQFGGTLIKVGQQLQDQADDLDVAEAKGKFDAGIADAALEAEKAPDFFERPALFARDARQLASDLTKSLKSSAAKRAFTQFVVRRLPSQIVVVKTDALEAMHADQAARLRDHLEFLKRQIAEQTSLDAQEELTAFGVDLVNRAQARNVETPESARVLRTGFLGDIVEIGIRQQLRLDPFLAEDTLLSGDIDIDPLKKENLLRVAKVRQAELLRLDREAEREADRKFKEERRLELGDLISRALRGDLTLDQIEEARQLFGFGPSEVKLLQDIVTNEPQGRSFGLIRDDVERRVHLLPPQITRVELFRLRDQHREGGRGLNRTDFLAFLAIFDSNVTATGSTARSQLLFEHRQGEDQIKLSMRSQHPSDVWNAAASQTLAVAMDEFRERSLALNPQGEKPMLAARAVIRQFLPILQDSAQAAINAKRGSLPFQTKQALVTARAIGQIDNDQYYEFMKELRELERAELVLRAVQDEIQRAEKSGRLADEAKPTEPPKEREPPPPGLEQPSPISRQPAGRPSPVVEVPPLVLRGREPTTPAPTPGRETIQRRFRR